MTMGEEFGARLRQEIRARFGEGKEREFARRIEMDPTQLSRTLNGTIGKVPEPETLVRYARGLGMPLIEMLGWIYPIDQALQRPAAPTDPLWLMMERVRSDHEVMRQLAELEEASVPEVFDEVIKAVAEAWLANVRMGLRVALAQVLAGRKG